MKIETYIEKLYDDKVIIKSFLVISLSVLGFGSRDYSGYSANFFGSHYNRSIVEHGLEAIAFILLIDCLLTILSNASLIEENGTMFKTTMNVSTRCLISTNY